MAIETTPLGFQKPDGNEAVRNGNDIIAANAQKAEDLHAAQRARLAQVEKAAGFPGEPLDLADDVVAGLVTTASDTRTALDARFPLKTEMVGKLDKTEAATTYAAKSVETTKLDKSEAATTYATPTQVTAAVAAGNATVETALALTSGATVYAETDTAAKPMLTRTGKVVELSGRVVRSSGTGAVVAIVPVALRPARDRFWGETAVNAGSADGPRMHVQLKASTGELILNFLTGSPVWNNLTWIPLRSTWVIQ